jgi:hypothetical protein
VKEEEAAASDIYVECAYNGNSLNKRAKIKRLAHISDKTRFVLKLGNCKVLMGWCVPALNLYTHDERFCCWLVGK